jgi:hypothetical protein
MKPYLLVLLISFVSCTQKDKLPDGILSPSKMQAVFWDYLKADALANEKARTDTTINDSLLNMQYQSIIFSHHKINKEIFYKSYQYYISNSPLMVQVLDSMLSNQAKQGGSKMFLDLQ